MGRTNGKVDKTPIKQLGSCPGIYFLYQKNKIIYIGQSKFPLERIITHAKEGRIKFDFYSIKNYPEKILLEKESKFILKYLPKFNRSIDIRNLENICPIGWVESNPKELKKAKTTIYIIGKRLYLDISKVPIKLKQKKRRNHNKA